MTDPRTDPRTAPRARVYILTGGTMVHVAPHFSLCAPAYGRVGEDIHAKLATKLDDRHELVLVRSKMALGSRRPSDAEAELLRAAGLREFETYDDLAQLLAYMITRPETAVIILACAVSDWAPHALSQGGHSERSFGETRPRLHSRAGPLTLELTAADKLIGFIRRERKDIFLVAFKATTGLDEQAQYVAGLRLLKRNSCNLVLANDLHTRVNMVVAPEEARYHVGTDRHAALAGLCEMIALRRQLSFTRTIVVEGEPVAWSSERIPANLRTVVDHCIARGAYDPFEGKSVGHFGVRLGANKMLCSRRKSDYTRMSEVGMVELELRGEPGAGAQIVATGGKPSAGARSQLLIFEQHDDVDCIVHVHCPTKPAAVDAIPLREQRPYECGSHECGRNTSEGLREVWPGIKAVQLDAHGPNVCFGHDADPARVIEFIEQHFDLGDKTGGRLDPPPHPA